MVAKLEANGEKHFFLTCFFFTVILAKNNAEHNMGFFFVEDGEKKQKILVR